MKTTIPFLCLVLLGCAHVNPNDDVAKAVANIKNSDIKWDGNPFGLVATVTGASSKLLKDSRFTDGVILRLAPSGQGLYSSQDIGPYLIKALKNKDQFVAAHVLLTQAFGFHTGLSAETWNALSIDIRADNSVFIPTNQGPILLELWKLWLKPGYQAAKYEPPVYE